jgi:hypothetical protein
MVMEIKPGDVVRLRKKHACGSYEWQVVRSGADIVIKCLKCQHRVRLERSVFERRVKAIISQGRKKETVDARRKELEAKLSDLKKRWPAHSVPLSMWREMEEIEEELDKIKGETQTGD